MGIDPLSLWDRTEGGLLGLLVGDALGVPYEFHLPHHIPPIGEIEFEPPAGYERAHAAVLPGTWSDDGAQALALLDSLLSTDGLDLEHFASRLASWRDEGLFAVDGRIFDIGIQTNAAIDRWLAGIPAERAGLSEVHHNGNGALMRVLPLALWHWGTDEELIVLAARQCLPTHGHPRAQVACALYCLWARALLQGEKDAWNEAVRRFHAHQPHGLFPTEDVSIVLDPSNAHRVSGSGYVVDCLWSSRHAVDRTTSYADCVRHAIALGRDTDTTAAVAGGIAGIMYGASGIPARWRERLRGWTAHAHLVDGLRVRLDYSGASNGAALPRATTSPDS